MLIKRMQQCIAQRKTLPDILAVDFTNVGDLISTVNKFNSAIAQVTGTAAFWTTVIDDGKTDTSLNAEDRQEIAGFKRLPTITTAAADSLLGSEASRLEIPDDVKTFQEIQSLGSSTSPTPSPPAPVGGSWGQRRRRRAPSPLPRRVDCRRCRERSNARPTGYRRSPSGGTVSDGGEWPPGLVADQRSDFLDRYGRRIRGARRADIRSAPLVVAVAVPLIILISIGLVVLLAFYVDRG